MSVEALGKASYVRVTSYRRDGTPVPTPVWAARDGDALVVWTPTQSWKVKRIRRNAEVTVAPCTARGAPLGEAVPATAEVLDPAETPRVRRLIMKKYWLLGPPIVLSSRLFRGAAGTIGVRITPANPTAG